MPTKPKGSASHAVRERSKVLPLRHVRAADREGASNVEALRAKTMAQCSEEFARTWGQRFHAPGGGGVGKRICASVDADSQGKQCEDEARALDRNVWKRIERCCEDIAKFRVDHGDSGAGGISAARLFAFEIAFAALRETFGPISATEAHFNFGRNVGRRIDGRPALVARVRQIARTLRIKLSVRDIAVTSILAGVGPGGWAHYGRKIRDGEVVTAAMVIEDEEERVRRMKKSD